MPPSPWQFPADESGSLLDVAPRESSSRTTSSSINRARPRFSPSTTFPISTLPAATCRNPSRHLARLLARVGWSRLEHSSFAWLTGGCHRLQSFAPTLSKLQLFVLDAMMEIAASGYLRSDSHHGQRLIIIVSVITVFQ